MISFSHTTVLLNRIIHVSRNIVVQTSTIQVSERQQLLLKNTTFMRPNVNGNKRKTKRLIGHDSRSIANGFVALHLMLNNF